jgi:DNA mismatch repair protein MutL
MPKIHKLPPEVYKLIAAGEIIERPASALKELLENSIDAGAQSIAVESVGAGRTLLRVKDDGSGMDKKDCEISLERHATSKISEAADLERLISFGFRGEALFAIASVSKLSIITAADSSNGWKVEAEAGKILSSKPAPAARGTVVEISELFFNTPARAKFLKSESTERSRLLAIIEEVALAHPSLRLSYRSEGKKSLIFSPESEPERLRNILGADLAQGLIPIEASREGIRLKLYVSNAGSMAATRSAQHWFVNRRPIDSRLLQQALYKGYGEHKNPGRHPVCVGFFELAPDAFDVNVHPGKREVRFKKEGDLFSLVSGLVATALAKAKTASPLTREDDIAVSYTVAEPRTAYRGSSRPSQKTTASFLPLQTAALETLEAGPEAPAWFTPPYRYLGQIEKSYLLFEAAGGLFILDQHAAAERILFERYLKDVAGGGRPQRLMLPLSIELPASAVAAVLSRKDRLEALGFEIESSGKTSLRVLGVPALFEKAADLKDLIHGLLDSVADPSHTARSVKYDAVATIACKAAIKAHDETSEREALQLLEDLKNCEDGSACPHGRRAMLALSREELARRFQRPGAVPL